ncbi:MAG: ABC transporter permease, partial [Planctomycetaceae bacterium]
MFHFALRNLLSRPMRSLLSLLGLTVAIAGMVGLFSVAEGIEEEVSGTFGRIPGMIAMQPGAPIPLFSKLPADWQHEIAAIPGVRVVNAEIWERANRIDGKTIVSPPRFLFGTDIATRIRLRSDPYRQGLEEGRYLELSDRGTTNCVISRPIADEFQKGLG